jgi:ubiquitin-protein ligase
MALKRIHKEIADIKKEDLGGIIIEPTDNLFIWHASIPGQEGSPYEGGLFRMEIHLPPDYPCVTTTSTIPGLPTFRRAC